MGLKTFIGGVHPYDGKELSKDAPIREVLPKGELVYPLSQHIGAPANPIVAVGDTVLKGQMIAEAGGFVSSPIFASVSVLLVSTVSVSLAIDALTSVLFALSFSAALKLSSMT